MAHKDQLSEGDRVFWRVGSTQLTGQILRKAICRLCIRNRVFEASPTAPRFIVRADKNGKLDACTAAELTFVEANPLAA